MGYRLTRRAEEDLVNLYLTGVRNFGIGRAEAYLAKLVSVFDLLAATPEMARLRPEFRPPVRIHPHGAHIIIYRHLDPDIVIVRVRHGREDWNRNPGGR